MRIVTTALLMLALATPAHAALKPGAQAPQFTTTGALAGKPFRLDLRRQLQRGPLVLYFYPKAFTQGCTLEANAFSENMAEFRKAGAYVVGLSADDYPTLRRFSTEACRGAFPVATASAATIAAYDVKLASMPGLSDRTSYVIAPDGRILYAHSSLDWRDHVTNTLAAVRRYRSGRKPGG